MSKLKKVNFKSIAPIVIGLISIIFIIVSLVNYGFWDDVNGPLPGFYPIIMGVILLASSIGAFFVSLKEDAPGFAKEELFTMIATAVFIVASLIIGLVPSSLIFMIIWLRVFDKSSWKSTLITTAIIGALVIGVFVMWLQVPFPWGIFQNLVYG